jgi:hypothetical protein
MILSYSLDVGHFPLGLCFFLILCFHILILILMLARSRSKLYHLFRKRLYSLEKSAVAEQQFILIVLLILDNTYALFTAVLYQYFGYILLLALLPHNYY